MKIERRTSRMIAILGRERIGRSARRTRAIGGMGVMRLTMLGLLVVLLAGCRATEPVSGEASHGARLRWVSMGAGLEGVVVEEDGQRMRLTRPAGMWADVERAPDEKPVIVLRAAARGQGVFGARLDEMDAQVEMDLARAGFVVVGFEYGKSPEMNEGRLEAFVACARGTMLDEPAGRLSRLMQRLKEEEKGLSRAKLVVVGEDYSAVGALRVARDGRLQDVRGVVLLSAPASLTSEGGGEDAWVLTEALAGHVVGLREWASEHAPERLVRELRCAVMVFASSGDEAGREESARKLLSVMREAGVEGVPALVDGGPRSEAHAVHAMPLVIDFIRGVR